MEAKPSSGITVVVPSYNRLDQLRVCVSKLLEQDFLGGQFEIIIVDDGSSRPIRKSELKELDDARIQVLRKENGGPGSARNFALSRVTSPFVAFTDDDCLPPPNWLRTLWECLQHNPGALVGGISVNVLSEDRFATASQLVLNAAYEFHNPASEPASFLASNNFACETVVIRRLGGFNEQFRFSAEDRDFCARLKLSGHEIVYVADAAIAHSHHLTLVAFWRQHFSYGRGAYRYHRCRIAEGNDQRGQSYRFHLSLPALLWKQLRSRSLGERCKLVSILVISFAANTCGYFSEKTLGTSRTH